MGSDTTVARQRQRDAWEVLVNAVRETVAAATRDSVQHAVVALFRRNVVRARGVFVTACLRRANDDPELATALLAAINSKIPLVGRLVTLRLLARVSRAQRRWRQHLAVSAAMDVRRDAQDAVVIVALLAAFHVIDIALLLQILLAILDDTSSPSHAAALVTHVIDRIAGQLLADRDPPSLAAILDALRGFLADGHIDRNTTRAIESLLRRGRTGFSGNPIPDELDLIEVDDQITHSDLTYSRDMDPTSFEVHPELDKFLFSSKYKEEELEYRDLRRAILGDSDDEDENDDDDNKDHNNVIESDGYDVGVATGDNEDDNDDEDDEDDKRRAAAARAQRKAASGRQVESSNGQPLGIRKNDDEFDDEFDDLIPKSVEDVISQHDDEDDNVDDGLDALFGVDTIPAVQEEGDDNAAFDGDDAAHAEAVAKYLDNAPVSQAIDMTETDATNLRKAIYLTIMSSLSFEECTHKLIKLQKQQCADREKIFATMMLQCCSEEKTYVAFYGLSAERLILLSPKTWEDVFMDVFTEIYTTAHMFELNRLRNMGKFFAHLLATNVLPWDVFAAVTVTENETTPSSRIFLKVLFQEMQLALGIKELKLRFTIVQPVITRESALESIANRRLARSTTTKDGNLKRKRKDDSDIEAGELDYDGNEDKMIVKPKVNDGELVDGDELSDDSAQDDDDDDSAPSSDDLDDDLSDSEYIRRVEQARIRRQERKISKEIDYLLDVELSENPFAGLFPMSKLNGKTLDDTRFSINFFTSIGLGSLTVVMREYLQRQQLQSKISST